MCLALHLKSGDCGLAHKNKFAGKDNARAAGLALAQACWLLVWWPLADCCGFFKVLSKIGWDWRGSRYSGPLLKILSLLSTKLHRFNHACILQYPPSCLRHSQDSVAWIIAWISS